MKSSLRSSFVIVLALLTSSAAVFAAEVHMSTGDDGVPVFSDQAPTDRPSQTIRIEAPPARDPARAQQRVTETIEAQERRSNERRDAAQTKAAAEQAAKRQQGACAAARNRLQSLTNQPPNRRLVIEPDGSARRVAWEEMQALIRAAEAQVAKDCAGVTNTSATASTRQPATPSRDTGSANARSTGTASERNASGPASERSRTP